MKRTKKKASLILTADWHVRESIPLCRTEEEFLSAQWRKMDFVSDLQVKHNCPVLHAGDLFEHWKPSPWLLTEIMNHLPAQFHTVYGQHDLPQHNIHNEDKSGIFTLKTASKLKLLEGVHWGQKPDVKNMFCVSYDSSGNDDLFRAVLVWHKMNYQGLEPWPGFEGAKAGGLLRKYDEYDLILTGDNHKAFVETYKDRILVNPGSLTRQDADQIDFKPRIYLYYADSNTVEPIYLPIEEGVVSREHIERDNERDERITAFISKLDGSWQAEMSFEKNLEKFFLKNKVRKVTKDICYKAIEA